MPQVAILRDKRLSSASNPDGVVGASLTEPNCNKKLAAEFDQALKIAGIVRDGRQSLHSDLSGEEFKQFVVNIRNDTSFLRFEPFVGFVGLVGFVGFVGSAGNTTP